MDDYRNVIFSIPWSHIFRRLPWRRQPTISFYFTTIHIGQKLSVLWLLSFVVVLVYRSDPRLFLNMQFWVNKLHTDMVFIHTRTYEYGQTHTSKDTLRCLISSDFFVLVQKLSRIVKDTNSYRQYRTVVLPWWSSMNMWPGLTPSCESAVRDNGTRHTYSIIMDRSATVNHDHL